MNKIYKSQWDLYLYIDDNNNNKVNTQLFINYNNSGTNRKLKK